MSQPSRHIRLVILGGRSVGKSAIIKRFLFNTFMEKHRATVEDLFYKEFNLGTILLKCDFLDTSGGFEFPAMRRLSIANGQAFCLVYAIDDIDSYITVKKCFEEIKELRSDFQEIPIIFAGNKADLPRDNHLVKKEEVTEWVYCELPRLRTKVLECSAKNNWNIRELMKNFLGLAKINLPTEEGSSLRRRSSAHASSVSKFRLNNLTPHIIPELIIDALTNPNSSDDNPIQKHLNGQYSPSNSPKHGDNQHSNSSLNLSCNTSNNNSTNTSADESTNNHHMTLGQRLKPRSRSLIRRTSKKVNKVKDTNNDPEDCFIQ